MSVISKRRVVSDISITNLSFTVKMVTCGIYQSRDWWVKYQSQTYLPFAFKNVTSEWYINHKPTYHLLSRNVTGEWYINHKPIDHLLSRNMTGEWYINNKPIYHLLSRNMTGEPSIEVTYRSHNISLIVCLNAKLRYIINQ